MKLKMNLKLILVMVAFATMASSCHIYKSFELPEEGVAGEVVKAQQEPMDSTSLGNLSWEQIFTDADLQYLISQALNNNKDIKNAKLNVDAANAQLLGAKLSYLPSIALAPNGAMGKVEGFSHNWTYTLPFSASWEIDIFGKVLNAKRRAKANLLQS